MKPNINSNGIGRGINPNNPANGVYGMINVTIATEIVAIKRYFPGLLLKKGLRLRMTRTIIDAEITDSRNQPVLKISGVAL